MMIFDEHSQGWDDRRKLAALLRAEADGELTEPEDRAELDRLLPSDSSRRIASERALREMTARAMGAVAAPAGLREAVAAGLERARGEESSLLPVADARGVRRSRQRMLAPLAMAAALAVTALGVWATIQFALPGSSQTPGVPGEAVVQAAAFAVGEHQHCEEDPAYRDSHKNVICGDLEKMKDFCKAYLGYRPKLDCMTESLTFVGGSACGVPGSQRSVHLRFKAKDPSNPCQNISMFIGEGAAVSAAEGMKVIRCSENPEAPPASVWSCGRYTYYVVTTDCNLARSLCDRISSP